MKITHGLSALLLGTTLLAGAAYADPQNNNPPPPPPHFNVHHAGNGGHDGSAWRNDHAGNFNSANRMRWNHTINSHDRNVAHFSAQDRAMWTQGQWKHTRHHGRDGWWWNTNGAWFFYDQPSYPYPGYVSDDYSFDDEYSDNGVTPSTGGYEWYYCNNPAGYYPYIQSCRGPWQPVTPNANPQQGQYQGQYDQGQYGSYQQGAPDANDEDDDRGPDQNRGPDQYRGQPNGPQQGYNDDNDDDDQGPPPGYNGNDQGPPPGYQNGDQDQGPPPGYGDQSPR